ncbi:MAG: NAD(P)H-hydrate dehydratase [Bacteroidales bacterium]|nr:NAD(P)H-hydrate dehydratase [Bacteroidales bacterium]
MQKIFSASQIRQADAYTIQHEPIPSIDLMERAVTSCYNWINENIPDRNNVTVVCGTGNNGGDGLALARMLGKDRKVSVVVLDSDNKSPDFKTNFERLEKCPNVLVTTWNQFGTYEIPSGTELLIDAVFGTGLNRPVEDWRAAAIKAMNAHKNSIHLALDIPSGLFADKPTPADSAVFEADITLSFQFAKMAFLFPENHRYVGQFFILPIGLSQEFISSEPTSNYLVDSVMEPAQLTHRPKFSHKGTYGHALLVAGSYGKMGAAILSARACLRTGAGLVTVHLPKRGVDCMQTAFPEAMVSIDEDEAVFSSLPAALERYNVVAVGPGIGTSDKTQAAISQLLNQCAKPMVIDADAINCLAMEQDLLGKVPEDSIFTPHHKEFERLAGEWADDFERLAKQRDFSARHKVIVVFKGAHTTVTLPDGRAFFNTTGNPGMATAGSGDVLTGIIAGLLAEGLSPAEAAVCGVFIHGRAGDRAFSDKGNGLIASDIVENVPFVM